jgi:gamma-glutamyl-gamma-aminobutyrate hydrolase PuuD
MIFNNQKLKLAITPRFFENSVEQLIAIEKKYYPFFKSYGHNIHLIPYMGLKPREYLDDLMPDAVIFAGGYRLHTDEIKKFEIKVLEETLKRKIPILAICCGMWTINYYFNGTLKFDESHQAFDGEKIDVKKIVHSVTATDFIKLSTYNVNTFHSKTIDRIGDGLNSFLIAEDDTIEGFYSLEKKIIGIQFHMENKGVSSSLTRQIMEKFEELCQRR